ncbi:2-dehydropantoate 2-reductase [Streptomyces halstedii]|uniref:2-dehydropantoate 2-reductase n=1 Tax=Streptomyces halstedii TaxID=1944 RepID=UPI00324B5673
MSHTPYTVVGGGAIGGTLAHALARAGHPVTLVDSDADHVAAIREHGLALDGADGRALVPVAAHTPEEYEGPPLERVLLAVKAQATDPAMRWIAPRLAPDGYVVSVQNGFNEGLIAEHIGPHRTVAAFVNIFADVTGPGVVRDGGPGAFVIGEPGGGPVSDRVTALVADLQAWGPARAHENIEGFLWAKAAFGAMLSATALADAPMADLIDRHRPTMYALAREVFRAADSLGIHAESFDAFDAEAFHPDAGPEARDAACDALTAWLRTQPKDRSGIWRDLAVRRRPVEVTTHYTTVFDTADAAGQTAPVLRAVVAGLRELESDPAGMSESRLDALDRRVAAGGLPDAPALTEEQSRAVRDWLADRTDALVADLAAYTGLESPSDDPAALDRCLDWLRGWLDDSLGAPASEERLSRPESGDVLIRRYAATGPGADTAAPVLLLCHYDTVWPLGTLEGWPFHRDGDRVTGPGVFDMKAGLVQAVWSLRALAALELPRPAVTFLLNGDEETGSLHSREAIVAEAGVSRATLVFEASAEGAVKTNRKGVGIFRLVVGGSEAHAGLDPKAGASAVSELAHQILRLEELQDHDAGTTLNVGVVQGGTRGNVTAGRATAELDVRVATTAERARITEALAATAPYDPRTRVTLEGGWNRPVFTRTPEVAHLYRLARACARPLGHDLREISVGGASDGNFVQDAGVPVLDGLGAVGAGAHARSEHVTVSGMVERAALAAGLLAAFATG